MITRTRWRKGHKVQVLLTSQEQHLFIGSLRHALSLAPLYGAQEGRQARSQGAMLGLGAAREAAE